MNKKSIKKRKIENTTFIIEMKSCENHSWQGILTWVESKKRKPFRSALELVKMLDSVITSNCEDSTDEEKN